MASNGKHAKLAQQASTNIAPPALTRNFLIKFHFLISKGCFFKIIFGLKSLFDFNVTLSKTNQKLNRPDKTGKVD